MAKVKVLVVEDEIVIAKDIKSGLSQLGYQVCETVNSGEKAIEYLQTNRPDIILMDIMLRGKMNGIEAAGIIKERFKLPVIFLTAYADEATLEGARKTEPYGYILKPFKARDLQAAIEVAIYKHGRDMLLHKERDLYFTIIENRENTDSIFVRADYRLNKIRFKDILYVEALKDYVVINTEDNTYTTHTTMKEMVRILPVRDFVRIHRSFIVNLDKIYSIKFPDLVIEGKMKVLPIGGLYRKALYGRLNMV